ncbi:uncharacterized protein [Chelonus insularis]|uniref:uncharacterized protein n=1 Tax=Chelonus insularis TaxID=460826 RepID=UPI001589B0B5|nr:uncharacterized protein LOC118073813 [Chelonus insularis]
MIRFSKLSVWFNLFFFSTISITVLTFQEIPGYTYVKTGDPDVHLQDYTYVRLTFLRGHVVGEQYLNKKGDCSATCSDYNHTRYYNHPDNSSLKQTIICNGHIYRCREIHHFSTFQTMRIDNQLYEFVYNKEINEYEFRKSDDHLAHFYWTKNHRFAMHDTLYDSSHCQMCKCYCDDVYNRLSVRAFCQDLVSSNTELGYVITGLRFAMKNRVILIEIQQGKLVRGNIDQNTIHWKTRDKCEYHGYLTYDHRSIQLDDVFVPPGEVITAVTWDRYDRPTNKLGHKIGRLSLSVRGTLLDDYGNLMPEHWTAYHKFYVRRSHLKVNRVDIPTSVTTKGQEIGGPNKYYIKFRPTDWFKDFAQHVVPFIDLQEVVTYPPKPLSGIGVYYRATEGFGGFLAFKVMFNKTLNYYFMH